MLSETVILDIGLDRSSLIKQLVYEPDSHLLTVYFHNYYTKYITYEDVYPNHFEELCKAKSIGQLYLKFIKPNFKQVNYEKMADRPKTKNLASNQKRFIKISINVQEIIKEWIIAGEKGAYLGITLQMLPDGELDRYGNLGMVTQDVPKFIYEKEKALPAAQRTKGPILGNGAELDWGPREGMPGETNGTTLSEEAIDDLPF